MAKETAEQKLLKIIEATDAQQQNAPAGTGTAVATEPAPSVAQVAASVKTANVAFQLPPFIENFLKNKSAPGVGGVSLGLKEINYLLLAVIAVGLLFLVFDFSKGMNYAKQEFDYEARSKAAESSENLIPSFRDMTDYVSVVSRRNIFQPYEKKEEVVKEDARPEDIRRITEQTKDLKLVGVSWLNSAESASALIENKNSGITYFLRQGETINGVAIKQIFADSVILTLEGDDIKLSL